MNARSSGIRRAGFIGTAAAVLCCGAALAQVTARVSVRSDGGQGQNFSGAFGCASPNLSADGRFVVFSSDFYDLAPPVTGKYCIFLYDRETGTQQRLSLPYPFWSPNGDSTSPSISPDVRFIAFQTEATNYVNHGPGDLNTFSDIVVCDRQAGTFELASVTSSQEQANGFSERPAISGDGRFVVFESWATNLAPVGFSFDGPRVYLRDRQNGTTELVSVDSNGVPGNDWSELPAVSGDGRYVVFTSQATNLVPGDTNGSDDVFLRDRQTGSTVRISVDASGNELQGYSSSARITSDGRFVVFGSSAPNLVPGGTAGVYDTFLKDLQTGAVDVVSVASDGTRADGNSGWGWPTVTPDGRYVAFDSLASNLVAGDTNATDDVFLHDRQTGTTQRISVTSEGMQGSRGSGWPAISDDGRFVAFSSWAPDLVPGDTNNLYDIFVRDHTPGAGTTAFTSFCEPGSSGVIDCPCSNPAAGPEQGCDNSAATGGARLSAAGISRIPADSLVFTTVGELPSSLSVLFQADALLPNGRVYGQGVRCLGGRMFRLYTKTAIGGAIEAPDFAAGDPTVSVRSAQKGDTILGGQSRWYTVYYRDPVVLGGCPASSTFNATQSGEIAWTY